MRRIKNKFIYGAKNIQASLWKRRLKSRFLHENVPYYSQWESRDLVEDIITEKISASDDPLWVESGAVDKEEYAEWSASGCGMACLKMIMAAERKQVVPLVELGKRSVIYGTYKLPLYSSPGMFYRPFVRFIEQEFQLRAKATSSLTMPEIKKVVSRGGYVIASVTPEIRFPQKPPMNRGGHLVLLLGYDDNQHIIYLHNPSGFKGSQEYVEVTYANFAKFFDRKGIIVFSS